MAEQNNDGSAWTSETIIVGPDDFMAMLSEGLDRLLSKLSGVTV